MCVGKGHGVTAREDVAMLSGWGWSEQIKKLKACRGHTCGVCAQPIGEGGEFAHGVGIVSALR